jgi:hypothetical protein
MCLAVAWWAVPSQAGAVVPASTIQFRRTTQGMMGTLCAVGELSGVDVLVGGSELLQASRPIPGAPCGPAGAGRSYSLLVDNSVINAHQGRHEVRVRISRPGEPPEVLDTKVLLAAGRISTQVYPIELVPGGLRIRGYAVDTDDGEPVTVRVWGDDARLVPHEATTLANLWNDSVNEYFPGYGGAHGFDVVVPDIKVPCLSATNSAGKVHQMGCPMTPNRTPSGGFGVAVQGRRIVLLGWVHDPDGAADVVLGLNGMPVWRGWTGSTYSSTLDVAPGTYEACATWMGFGDPGWTAPTCRQVVVK